MLLYADVDVMSWVSALLWEDVVTQNDVGCDVFNRGEQRRAEFTGALVAFAAKLGSVVGDGVFTELARRRACDSSDHHRLMAYGAAACHRDGDLETVAGIVDAYTATASACAMFCQLVAETICCHLDDIALERNTEPEHVLREYALTVAASVR